MNTLLTGVAAAAAISITAAAAATAMPNREPLSQKESFMLMFGKGNGAMRVLCALQKEGVIDQATRQLWVNKLDLLLSESADSAVDRRNTRIGMAFADARRQLCPTRIMGRSDP
ncbi:MAG: hypothetical protein FJ078_01155 [Cyanobacteria bacterium K_DeepCast_35m_m2_155]|nr:hypothetical protein [Cyanobacteria bacterium K_DeepCast_35m_m2_155]